jgi:small GTP-binding protein
MTKLKIVVTGPVSAGKTTFIHSLADQAPVSTEQRVRRPSNKSKTTVALDFGRTTVAERSVNLFGTPGQERFHYMRELLIEGTDGLVLLVPADQDDGLEKTQKLMAQLASGPVPPLVVGITRTDLAQTHAPQAIRQAFGARALHVKRIDARAEDHCRGLVTALVSHA